MDEASDKNETEQSVSTQFNDKLRLEDAKSNAISDVCSDTKEESNASICATPNPPKSEEINAMASVSNDSNANMIAMMEAPPNLVTEETATTTTHLNKKIKRKPSLYDRSFPKKKGLTSDELEAKRMEEERQKFIKLRRKNARVASRMREAHHIIQPVKPLQLTIPKSPVLATSTRASTHRASISSRPQGSNSVPKLRKRKSCTDVDRKGCSHRKSHRPATDENANPNASRPSTAGSNGRSITKPVPFHLSEGRRHCCAHASPTHSHHPVTNYNSDVRKGKVFSGLPMVKTRKLTEPKTPYLRTKKMAERRKKFQEIKPLSVNINQNSQKRKPEKPNIETNTIEKNTIVKTEIESTNVVTETMSEEIQSENIEPLADVSKMVASEAQ